MWRMIFSMSDDKKGKLKKIHVNQHVLRDNLKNKERRPAITVKSGKENLYGNRVNIYDEQGKIVATVTQPKDRKLSCGARVWIETRCKVEVINEE